MLKIIKNSPLSQPRWPWSKMDIIEVARSAANGKIWMPGIGFIDVDTVNGWRAELGDAANSKRLWLNSLVSAHACLEAAKTDDKNHRDTAYSLLRSYLDQYQSGNGIFSAAWKDEHAVANRLFVLTEFLHESCSIDSQLISQIEILHHADLHARWLANDENYVKNNHGVMMDLALAQFGIFISTLEPNAASNYIDIAQCRLEMMLSQTFDSKGCCTENSPAYHFVNYALFQSIYDVAVNYQLPINYSKWSNVLEQAREVGNSFLRADGTLPTIGDSENKPSTFFPISQQDFQEGVGFFPESGFFIFNRDNLQLTMRAGGSVFSHRHVDDLSITFWAHGKDFIIDGGLYNYDTSDRMRRWFVSTRAHSGFYLESEGHVLFRNYKSPSEMSRFVSMKSGEDFFEISATHNLSKEAPVTRTLSFNGGALSISDKFNSEIEQKWRAQFILHPDVEIFELPEKNGYILRSGEKKIILRVNSEGISASIENSFYSKKFMDIINTKAIVFKGSSFGIDLNVEIAI